MTKGKAKSGERAGFTLIEMSIVLVIIGLIVGGILTGQELIASATIRAQISQITRYNTAVRTFQNKYGYLPGDIPNPPASSFGFSTRGAAPGQGDGNGIIEGDYNGTNAKGAYPGTGEIAIFWSDLSIAGLIDAGIQNYDALGANYPSAYHNPGMIITLSTTPSVYQWLPQAKLGNGNFVYVLSNNSTNMFGVSAVISIRDYMDSAANPGITVQQAYNIDSKIDDGLPLGGTVTVCYNNSSLYSGVLSLAAGGGVAGADGGWKSGFDRCTQPAAGIAWAATNCYDDNGGALSSIQYSISKNAGIPNCALSFRFQ